MSVANRFRKDLGCQQTFTRHGLLHPTTIGGVIFVVLWFLFNNCMQTLISCKPKKSYCFVLYFLRNSRKIRGAQTFVFYGPPTFPWFLSELLDSRYVPDASADGNAGSVISVTILYFPPLEAHMVATLTGKIDL